MFPKSLAFISFLKKISGINFGQVSNQQAITAPPNNF
jgi:hypothetical protein